MLKGQAGPTLPYHACDARFAPLIVSHVPKPITNQRQHLHALRQNPLNEVIGL